MQNYDFEIDSKDKDELISRAQESQDGWLNSYSDIVTLLLCFFIIFYALEKVQEKGKKEVELNNVIANLRADIAREFEENNSNARGGSSKARSNAKNIFTKEVFSILKLENQKSNIDVLEEKDYLTIIFKDEAFFNLGKSHLNKNGEKVVADLFSKLVKVQDKIRIDVRGHTDSVPIVRVSKNTWWRTNMELSVARALSVRSELVKLGFHEEALFVSGMGELQSLQDIYANSQEVKNIDGERVDLSKLIFDRRISFKIEPRTFYLKNLEDKK